MATIKRAALQAIIDAAAEDAGLTESEVAALRGAIRTATKVAVGIPKFDGARCPLHLAGLWSKPLPPRLHRFYSNYDCVMLQVMGWGWAVEVID